MTLISGQVKFLTGLLLSGSVSLRTIRRSKHLALGLKLNSLTQGQNVNNYSRNCFHNFPSKTASLNELKPGRSSNSDLLSIKNKYNGHVITCSLRKKAETLTSFKGIEIPEERQKLTLLPKVPPLPTLPRKMPMAGHLIRGEEEIHTDFLHKQYGVVALRGGFMRHGHLEMIRRTIQAKINPKKMFAIWRVDAPWKAHSKKGIGRRMGMGKGNISFYTTPVKAKRVIFEVAGKCTFEEVQPMLKIIAHILPFPAAVMSQEMIEQERIEEQRLENENLNPYTFKYIIQNNMLGSRIWAKKEMDLKYFGKYE